MLCLFRRRKGNWQELQTLIKADILEEFEKAGYINHIGDEWHVDLQKRTQAILSIMS